MFLRHPTPRLTATEPSWDSSPPSGDRHVRDVADREMLGWPVHAEVVGLDIDPPATTGRHAGAGTRAPPRSGRRPRRRPGRQHRGAIAQLHGVGGSPLRRTPPSAGRHRRGASSFGRRTRGPFGENAPSTPGRESTSTIRARATRGRCTRRHHVVHQFGQRAGDSTPGRSAPTITKVSGPAAASKDGLRSVSRSSYTARIRVPEALRVLDAVQRVRVQVGAQGVEEVGPRPARQHHVVVVQRLTVGERDARPAGSIATTSSPRTSTFSWWAYLPARSIRISSGASSAVATW